MAAQQDRPREGPRRRHRVAGPHRAARRRARCRAGSNRRRSRIPPPPPLPSEALTEVIDPGVLAGGARAAKKSGTGIRDDDDGDSAATTACCPALRGLGGDGPRHAPDRAVPPARRSTRSPRARRPRRARRPTTRSSPRSRACCSSSRSMRASPASRAVRRSRSTRSSSATGVKVERVTALHEQHHLRGRLQRGAHPLADPGQERDRRRDPQHGPRDRHARRRAALARPPSRPRTP